jgi:hypothetical protein
MTSCAGSNGPADEPLLAETWPVIPQATCSPTRNWRNQDGGGEPALENGRKWSRGNFGDLAAQEVTRIVCGTVSGGGHLRPGLA